MHQLVNSQFIQEPLAGEEPSTLFLIHEYAGLASFALVVGFWIWTVVRRGETRFGRLLPWFSVAAVRDVWIDLRTQAGRLARGRAPDDEDGALASATHGLGLLVVSLMTVTGAAYFFAEGSGAGDFALDIHRLFANAMWAYLIAHAGVAILHAVLGSDILSRMFWLRRGRASAATPAE